MFPRPIEQTALSIQLIYKVEAATLGRVTAWWKQNRAARSRFARVRSP